MPRAILTALAVATLVYLAVQTVAQGVLGPELPTYTDAPLAETAARLMGDAGKLFLLVGGTVSIFGYIAGDMLGTPRALLALARNGVLPRSVATVHPRYRTPAVAIIVYAVIVAALAISSSFEKLVIMANVSALLLYLLCVAASYELAAARRENGGEALHLPGGAAIQLLAAAGIVWLLLQATARRMGNSRGCCLDAASRVLRVQSPVSSEGFRFLGFAGAGPVTSLGPRLSCRSASSQSSRSAPWLPPRPLVDFVRPLAQLHPDR